MSPCSSNRSQPKLRHGKQPRAARPAGTRQRSDAERRARRVIYGLVGAGAAVTLGAAVLCTAKQPQSDSPDNSTVQSDINSEIEAPGGISADEPYFPFGADESSGKPIVDVYLDFMCPFCALFPEVNNEDIKRLAKDKDVVLRVHTTTMLDQMSTTGDYSTRAANAAACMYDSEPNKFLDFENQLFAHQPKEGTSGLSDERIEELASASVTSDELSRCIADLDYAPWLHSTVQTDALENISGTPSIFINGELWDDSGTLWTEPGELRSAILDAGD